MRLLKWIVLGLAGVAALVVAVFLAGSLLSLDWQRSHAAATRALPVFSGFSGGEERLVRIPVGDMEFRARVAGDRGPGVLLLHGFPVTSAMFEPLLASAAAGGYRAVAFDQRGYSPGARPQGADAYTVTQLTADALGVADAVGFDRFHLVGHDWGSVVGWAIVLGAPERVLSWSALSIPHPTAFSAALDGDPDQQRRSGYFRFFSTPWLPEVLFTFNGLAMMRDEVYGPMTEAQRAEYLRVFAEPGALTAALDWYRAIARSREAAGAIAPEVVRPTLFLWGNDDPAVGRGAVEAQREHMRGPYREVELDAGHWVMEEQGPRAIEEIRAHWSRNDPPPPDGSPALPDAPPGPGRADR